MLRILADDYKNVHRFVVAVYPSADDDVITSPYNCLLAMNQITEHADCVMPIDNQSLVNIVNKVDSVFNTTNNSSSSSRLSLSITAISAYCTAFN